MTPTDREFGIYRGFASGTVERELQRRVGRRLHRCLGTGYVADRQKGDGPTGRTSRARPLPSAVCDLRNPSHVKGLRTQTDAPRDYRDAGSRPKPVPPPETGTKSDHKAEGQRPVHQTPKGWAAACMGAVTRVVVSRPVDPTIHSASPFDVASRSPKAAKPSARWQVRISPSYTFEIQCLRSAPFAYRKYRLLQNATSCEIFPVSFTFASSFCGLRECRSHAPSFQRRICPSVSLAFLLIVPLISAVGLSLDPRRNSERDELRCKQSKRDACDRYGRRHDRDCQGRDQAHDQAGFCKCRNSPFGHRVHKAYPRADVDFCLRRHGHCFVPFYFSADLNETRGSGFSVVVKPYPPKMRDWGNLDTLPFICGCFGKSRGARRALDRSYLAEKKDEVFSFERSNPNQIYGFKSDDLVVDHRATLRSRQWPKQIAYSKGCSDSLRCPGPEQGTFPALRISRPSVARFKRRAHSNHHALQEGSR